MSGKIVKTINTGDWHFGHSTVPTEKIASVLNEHIGPNSKLSDVDYLFVQGDVFDSIYTLPESFADITHLYIGQLLDRCYHHGVKLRVLEGTPGHDRKQSRLFVILNELRPTDRRCDLQYIEELCIVREEDLDILYVPDEWRHDPMDVWEDVISELNRHGLEKVDVAIMHGFFDYQVPPMVKLPAHNSTNYQSITKHFITINHWHVHSSNGRIIAPGSPERLRHNEEGPKGMVTCTLCMDDPSKSTATFVETKATTQFKIIKIEDMTLESAKDYIVNTIREYEEGTHFRIDSVGVEGLSGVVSALKRKYPMFIWDFKIVKTKKKKDDAINELLNNGKKDSIVVNKNTITKLLQEQMETLDIKNQDKVMAMFKSL